MKLHEETYLGDGLYASFDGYQIKLRAPREEGDQEVYLEPSVITSFIKFVGEVNMALRSTT
jgi:hypothetical protein